MHYLTSNVKALRLILHYESFQRFTAQEASDWYKGAHPPFLAPKRSKGRWIRRLLPTLQTGESTMEETIKLLVGAGYLEELGLTSFTNRALKAAEKEYQLTPLADEFKKKHRR